MQQHSPLDHLIDHLDNGLRTLFGVPQGTGRANPSEAIDNPTALSESERTLAAGLMRVNHAGEVAAQALYQGQSWVARNPETRQSLRQSAVEENDHLLWCQQRLQQLDSHTSYLNPCWYLGSCAIGVLAGIVGDQWSLGFIAETEHQVMIHLNKHLEQLPGHDYKSRKIIEQMHQDEAHHANVALQAGGQPLPQPIRFAMRMLSKVMTQTTFWV